MKAFIGLSVTILFVVVVVDLTTAIPQTEKSHVAWTDLIPDHVDVDTLKPVPIANPKNPRQVTGRIYGGNQVAAIDSPKYKHQAKLLVYKPAGVFTCGGSIISKRVVVTAAHCLTNGNEGEIFFGLRNQNELYKAQSQELYRKNFRIHTGWNPDTMANDIGLIVLSADIIFSDIVGAIAVPEPDTSCQKYTGLDTVISGWGQTTNAENSASDILKTSTVKGDTAAQCKDNYGYKFNVETMICINASKNSGTCRGDSGGPLVYNENGTPYLIGVTSYGAVGCVQQRSRVFTCISAYLKWISLNSK